MAILEVPSAHKNLIHSNVLSANVSGIGLGHLGSWTILGLAKLGVPEFYLYDFDDVERRNISGTPYTVDQLNTPKVEALKSLILAANYESKFVKTSNLKVEKPEQIGELTDYYILSTDTLNSRYNIFTSILKRHDSHKKQGYLIDMRSRSKLSEVYVINLRNELSTYWYEKSIVSRFGDKTEPVHCNEANIIQNSYLTSSVAIQAFSDILDGDNSTRFMRISTEDFHLSSFKVPLKYFESEFWKEKLKIPCVSCDKNHKTKKSYRSCTTKRIPKLTKAVNDGLPERDAIF